MPRLQGLLRHPQAREDFVKEGADTRLPLRGDTHLTHGLCSFKEIRNVLCAEPFYDPESENVEDLRKAVAALRHKAEAHGGLCAQSAPLGR